MRNAWFTLSVVLFWMASMTWLVWTKVLPPLLVGQPPTYWSIVDNNGDSDEHVGWDLFWNDEPVGTAASNIVRADDGVVQMFSRIDFTGLSLEKISPVRIGSLQGFLGDTTGGFPMQAEARFEIDPLGRLMIFESALDTSLLPEPIRVLGTVEGNQLRLSVRSGEFVYKTNLYLAPERPLGSALAPQMRLPGLRIGQTWTEPVYNPFQPPNQPMEILEVVVDREEFLLWNSNLQRTLLVLYRPDHGATDPEHHSAERARAWVRRDGLVLQQDVRLLNAWLRFVRQPAGSTTSATPRPMLLLADPRRTRPMQPEARVEAESGGSDHETSDPMSSDDGSQEAELP